MNKPTTTTTTTSELTFKLFEKSCLGLTLVAKVLLLVRGIEKTAFYQQSTLQDQVSL